MGAPKIDNFTGKAVSAGAHTRTERLVISRPFQAADAFQLVVLTNDPLERGGLFTAAPSLSPLADAQDFIALPRAKKGCFAAVRVGAGAGGPFVGCVGAVVHEPPRISSSASGSACPITASIMGRRPRGPCSA